MIATSMLKANLAEHAASAQDSLEEHAIRNDLIDPVLPVTEYDDLDARVIDGELFRIAHSDVQIQNLRRMANEAEALDDRLLREQLTENDSLGG